MATLIEWLRESDPAAALPGTAELLAENWLGADVTGIVDWFLEHRLADGGWNCAWVEGSTRSSYHSTLNSLKGLLAYDVATGGTDATREARRSGEEYLLQRHLIRRLSTGERVAPGGSQRQTVPRRSWPIHSSIWTASREAPSSRSSR